MHTKFYFECVKGRFHLGCINVDGRILLKWIFK
jgi:hypothetical protein